MNVQNKALILDLVEWIAVKPRRHAEALDAWRTSCPRLSIWEDALALGLIACERRNGDVVVVVTPGGAALLHAERPSTAGRD
jgi:hypothetical protein